jgi:hypothetical protein
MDRVPTVRVYSHVVASDSGFAPNPFGGHCTLACCKPVIRRTARVGDWIVGLTRRSRGVVYAMRVTEKMDFATYWADPRFRDRRPDPSAASIRVRCGDNIYLPLDVGGFRQLPSGHSHPDGTEHPGMKARDLSGRFVLVSDDYAYFGSAAPALPNELSFLRVGRGHRCHHPAERVEAAVAWLDGLERGVHAGPRRWPVGEESWRERSRKFVLSRKGFDSSSGGAPSPILPDGTLVPLPIPDRNAAYRYDEIEMAGLNLGSVVRDLTRGHVRPDWRAHLDPDLDRRSLPRRRGWRPLFGQCAAAQGVLKNQGVGPGDVFLFFGWFRRSEWKDGRLRFVRKAPNLHVLFGWLTVGEVLRIGEDPVPAWAEGHPHLVDVDRPNNTLYVAADAGLFPRYDDRLRLTVPGASRSVWRLPGWFHPGRGRPPLGAHGDPSRWSRDGEDTILRSVARGQEFVLDGAAYPEADAWYRGLLDVSPREG